MQQNTQRAFTQVLFIVMNMMFSYYFTWLRFTLNTEGQPTLSLLNGTGPTPFQFRVLILWLVKWILQIKLPLLDEPSNLFFLIEMFSVFFLVIAFQHYFSLFIKNKLLSSYLSFSMFYVLPFNFLLARVYPFWHPGDMPSVLFFTIGLFLIYKQNMGIFYPVFVLATLNRETSCFLTFVYLLTAIGRIKPAPIVFHCALQAFIWGFIKYLIRGLYADNPGTGFFENHLSTNIAFLSNPKNYPFLFSVFGFVWIPVLFYHSLIQDIFVKRSLLIVFPFFAGMTVVGVLPELRIYGELVPVVLTAFLLIAMERLKKEFI